MTRADSFRTRYHKPLKPTPEQVQLAIKHHVLDVFKKTPNEEINFSLIKKEMDKSYPNHLNEEIFKCLNDLEKDEMIYVVSGFKMSGVF